MDVDVSSASDHRLDLEPISRLMLEREVVTDATIAAISHPNKQIWATHVQDICLRVVPSSNKYSSDMKRNDDYAAKSRISEYSLVLLWRLRFLRLAADWTRLASSKRGESATAAATLLISQVLQAHVSVITGTPLDDSLETLYSRKAHVATEAVDLMMQGTTLLQESAMKTFEASSLTHGLCVSSGWSPVEHYAACVVWAALYRKLDTEEDDDESAQSDQKPDSYLQRPLWDLSRSFWTRSRG